jgi:hypothetical protein
MAESQLFPKEFIFKGKYGFRVSGFQGFNVPGFQGFKVQHNDASEASLCHFMTTL